MPGRVAEAGCQGWLPGQAVGKLPYLDRSAFQAAGLAVHVFDDDVVDFAEGHHVLEDFIRFVCMEVEFDELVIADDEEFLTLDRKSTRLNSSH